jgi:hypothetical protein
MMATTVLDNQYVSSKFVYETDLEGDDDTKTLRNITNGSATVRSITVLNGPNTGQDVYLKLYDTSVDVVAGTTEADYVIQITQGVDATITFGSAGLYVANGLSARLVTGAATSDVTNATSAVIVEITYT